MLRCRRTPSDPGRLPRPAQVCVGIGWVAVFRRAGTAPPLRIKRQHAGFAAQRLRFCFELIAQLLDFAILICSMRSHRIARKGFQFRE